MPVILFCFSFKGGVGKTSGALAIASCLSSLYSKKVLLVDCDPSTNLTAFFQQSIGKEDAFTNTIKDCLTGDVSPEFAIRRFTYMRVPGEGKERDRYYTNVISPVLEECVENTPSKNVTRTCILDFLPGDSSIGTLTFDDNTVLRSMFEDLDGNYRPQFYDDYIWTSITVLDCPVSDSLLFLDYIDRKWDGNICNLLLANGLSSHEIDLLRAKCVKKP